MATSAGKSTSSIAALALLVVVAAMMTSGASAAFTLKNGCTAAISLTVQTQVLPLPPVNLTLAVKAGATAALPLPIVGGVLKLVQIKIGAKVYVLPLEHITNLTGTLGLLTNLTVTCDAAPCGKGKISVVATANVNNKVVTATICIKL